MPPQILLVTPGTSTTPIAGQFFLDCHVYLPDPTSEDARALVAALTYTHNNLTFVECTSLAAYTATHADVSPVLLESLGEVIAFGKSLLPTPPPPLPSPGDAVSLLNGAFASLSSSRRVDPMDPTPSVQDEHASAPSPRPGVFSGASSRPSSADRTHRRTAVDYFPESAPGLPVTHPFAIQVPSATPHPLSSFGGINPFTVRRKWALLILIMVLNLTWSSNLFLKRWLGASKYVQHAKQSTTSHEMPVIPKYNYTRPIDANPWPKVAWLMSFPNSGTSYTGELVRRATRTASATNYGSSNVDGDGKSVPLYDWSPIGPFITDPERLLSGKLIIPDTENSYILTKTHCGGTCFGCPPKLFLRTPEEFQDDCLQGDYKNTTFPKQKAIYDPSIVSRAVHLIRDPFDNIVSRFHLKRNQMQSRGDKDWLAEYPNTREGFRKFCSYVNTQNNAQEDRFSNVFSRFRDTIPCYSDFIRYVLWHNNAVKTTRNLDIKAKVLFYEDYETDQVETTDKLLHFLGLNRSHSMEPFKGGKSYRDHFEADEIEEVRYLIEQVADEKTREFLERYFE